MGKITVELIRKRAEHNEGEIRSLEELALHQEKLEKIEIVDRICRKLKILLLQNNAISKIENVSRLKELEYLNLALNSVERVENLEGCESLKKLDLTLNFIAEITSLISLRSNYNLEQLYLIGNPCHDFPGYREYVIAILPQLKQLDGKDIKRSERILARQKFQDVKEMVLKSEEAYFRDKKQKRPSAAPESMKSTERGNGDDCNMLGNLDGNDEACEDDDETFWSKVTGNTPESRLEMCRMLERQDKEKSGVKEDKPLKIRRYFDKDDQPLSCNEPKLSFSLNDDMDRNLITLDLAIPRHMCTTLIDANVQPHYVRVTVKGKIFQLRLSEEVKPDSSFARRSQTTGHLIITMPKVHQNSILVRKDSSSQVIDLTTTSASEASQEMKSKLNRRDATEINEEKKASQSKLVEKKVPGSDSDCTSQMTDSSLLEHEVPPLIY